MMTLKFVYCEEDGFFIGWLEDSPDYRTQGETLAELEENLKEIHEDLTSGAIPSIRRVGENKCGAGAPTHALHRGAV